MSADDEAVFQAPRWLTRVEQHFDDRLVIVVWMPIPAWGEPCSWEGRARWVRAATAAEQAEADRLIDEAAVKLFDDARVLARALGLYPEAVPAEAIAATPECGGAGTMH